MDFVISLTAEYMHDASAWARLLAQLDINANPADVKEIYLRVDDLRMEF